MEIQMKSTKIDAPSVSELLTKIEASQFHTDGAGWLYDLRNTTAVLTDSYEEIREHLAILGKFLGTKSGSLAVTPKQRLAIDEVLGSFLSFNAKIRHIKKNARIGYLHRYDEDSEYIVGVLSDLKERLDL